MPLRLTKIDKLTFPDHYRLDNADECYFIGEYTARAGFNYSATNDLISNLKKGMDRKDRAEWKYKVRAISQAASQLREALPPEIRNGATFLPVPPAAQRRTLYTTIELFRFSTTSGKESMSGSW
jgi:hypothetical protein